jgi:tRNA (Thr-GGU) A37 N-methylase
MPTRSMENEYQVDLVWIDALDGTPMIDLSRTALLVTERFP